MKAILVLALFTSAVVAVPRNPQRIVGGTLTTIEQYPSIVALLYSWDLSMYIHECGGSIINNWAILTAAHCLNYDEPIHWRVRVGSTWRSRGGDLYQIGYIANHPNYNSVTYDNDIAIIRTTSAMVHHNHARPALIAGPNYGLGDNQVVWGVGWGLTFSGGPYSDQLRHVQILTVNQGVCRYRYTSVQTVITDNMLCSGVLDVGGRDQCQGDSGGPLYHNGVVVGICSVGNGCGDAYYPGVNTRVSRYTAWIQANA